MRDALHVERLPATATPVVLRVNGAEREVELEPRTTLLVALRDLLGLRGAKDVCDRGACGACTVLLDGKPVVSCMVLALDARGREIRTIEGLGGLGRPEAGGLDGVQAAFVEHDALMCGFCTPGMVMSVRALLDQDPEPTAEAVRQAVAGNICRCGTYPRVIEAALAAARTARERS